MKIRQIMIRQITICQKIGLSNLQFVKKSVRWITFFTKFAIRQKSYRLTKIYAVKNLLLF